MPIDVVPVEGTLEDPVLKLQLCLLRLGHVLEEVGRDLDLAAVLDEPLDGFDVVRDDERVADILRDPVVLRPLQIEEDLLVVLLEFLCEFSLQCQGHFPAATAAFESPRLIDFFHEEVSILGPSLLACSKAKAAPKGPAAATPLILVLLFDDWGLPFLLALVLLVTLTFVWTGSFFWRRFWVFPAALAT